VLTTITEFKGRFGNPRGSHPGATLLEDDNGFLWGTTEFLDASRYFEYGPGPGYGTIFKINRATGDATTVMEFTGIAGPVKGAHPKATLVKDGSGFLWGTTANGGAADMGTIYKINPATEALTTIAEFTGTTGAVRGHHPVGTMVSDGLGWLRGTTAQGGTRDNGTIFKVNTATGAVTTLIEFGGNTGAARGSEPSAGLMRDAWGDYWGTTNGGATGDGTVFTLTGSDFFTHVFDFTGLSGAFPGTAPGALLLHNDGNIYGTTLSGGTMGDGRPAGNGQVFRLRLHSPLESWRHTHFDMFFSTGNAADNADPDKDGIENIAEFAFGLHPRRDSAGELPRGQLRGDDYLISFAQPAGVSGITYGAESSTDLQPGSWLPIPDTGTPPQHTFRLSASTAPRIFLRLTVSAP
jgi:uncharacterized repeat protein (TIGR03803 family)